MKKRFIFLLSAIALFTIIASCTPAGAELGLVGTWKTTFEGMNVTLDIRNDDTITMSVEVIAGIYASIDGKIIKADSLAKTITIDMELSELVEQYGNIFGDDVLSGSYSLSADGKTLTIDGMTFTKK
jgi:hypothetical protein